MADMYEIDPPPGAGNGKNEQDLFSEGPKIAPPPVKRSEDAREIPPLPPPAGRPETTNRSSEPEKPPLVFSDRSPLPQRSGEMPKTPPVSRNAGRPKRKAVHLDPAEFQPDCGFGILLKAARAQAGYTLEQVEAMTKLRPYYLTALEESDLPHLPPMVYVHAYVRSLKELYGLDDESMALIQEKLRKPEDRNDVPHTLIQDLERDGLINEKENERILHIFWAGAAAVALVVILIVWLIVAALLRSSSPEPPQPADPPEKTNIPESVSPSGQPEFRLEDFDELTAPQVLEPSTLQMNRKPSLMQ